MPKTFVKTYSPDGINEYCIYKITNYLGQTYYVADGINRVISRSAQELSELYAILKRIHLNGGRTI